jgi:hypothetical protein
MLLPAVAAKQQQQQQLSCHDIEGGAQPTQITHSTISYQYTTAIASGLCPDQPEDAMSYGGGCCWF